MAISSQVPKGKGSETTGLPDHRAQVSPKRPTPKIFWGEDIVQSSRKREAVLKRLVTNLKISKKGCWEWQGATTNGYGSFRDAKVGGNVKILAHRAAWVAFKGEALLPDVHVCHHCDNPICFNPDHLFLGTHHENMMDRDSKKRTLSGELVATSVYSSAEIDEVKRMLNSGMTGVAISEVMGISQAHISRIRRGYSRVSETQIGKNYVHANRKYSDEELERVAALLVEGQLSAPKIAELVGVSRHLVGDMRKGKAHKRFMERAMSNDHG